MIHLTVWYNPMYVHATSFLILQGNIKFHDENRAAVS